ncbi:MAG: NB-ARC domain-containing protein [Microcoleaceae cyanobacterium]
MSRRRRRGFTASPSGLRKLETQIAKRGFTQEDLAEAAEVSTEQVRKLLNPSWGRRIEKDAIRKIAHVLDLQPAEIVAADEWLPPVESENQALPMPQSPRERREQLHLLANQNLPTQTNDFVGREKELCNLMSYLSRDHAASIITVDGIGGVGKTALVLEAAYRCLERREGLAREINAPDCSRKIPLFDAIIFISAKESYLLPTGIVERLEAQRTLQEIYRTILNTLDSSAIFLTNFGEQLDRVKLSLKQQRTLLIIDNLETIEDKDKVQAFLYDLPPGVKSIITTREQLGYVPIRLDCLSEADSLKLIQQQLQEKAVHLTCNDQRKLYEASSGVPIVIIYAVGRLSSSSSLETVLDDLKDSEGDIAHFCFKKAVEDLKGQPAYRLMVSIAIFHRFPIREAVVQVAGLYTEPIRFIDRALEKLQQLSLVRFRKGRYGMLPLTREYVLAELAKEPKFKHEILNHWVTWYIDLAQKYRLQSQQEKHGIGYGSIEDEWDNFLAVLRWCKDEERYEDVKQLWNCLNNYANLRGLWEDRLFWLGWIIKESTRRGDHACALKSRAQKGRILILMGGSEQLEKAEKLLLQVWELRSYAHFQTIDYITNHLAGLYIRLGQYQESHRWLDIEQERLDQENLSEDERISYQIYIDRERAEVYFWQQNYDQAKQLCHQVIERTESIHYLRSRNYAQRILADILIMEGDLEQAENLLKAGFDEVAANKDKRRIACYQASFAMLEMSRKNYSKATSWASKAHNNFIRLGMTWDAKRIKRFLKRLTNDQ